MHALAVTAAIAALASPASALIARDANAPPVNDRHPIRDLFKREITDDATKVNDKAFDFVIAGGGLAGLAIAARLSEWSNVTVCVIEAGTDGSEVQQQIDIPGEYVCRSRQEGSAPLGTSSAQARRDASMIIHC